MEDLLNDGRVVLHLNSRSIISKDEQDDVQFVDPQYEIEGDSDISSADDNDFELDDSFADSF